ncbi:MAG: hypothetical protein HZB91_13470 [Elusimicrobia bacterium]|nr:hypothetical protein [Elusimicrobiota bacterium]
MNFKKTLAVLFAVAALSSPAFSAVNSPALASLKGFATGDEFGLPETQIQPAVSGWQELVLKVAQNGVFTPGNDQIPANLGLEKIQGSAKGTHHADYINVWGVVDKDTFVALFVTMVSEQWTLNGDTWTIDQWIHIIDMAGTPRRVSKGILIENIDGRVLDMKSEKVEVGDPAVAAHRNGLLDMWKAFKPQPKTK